MSTKIESGNDGAGNVSSNYIVSVSMSKKYLFSYFQDQESSKEYVNIIDIQNERVIAKVRINSNKNEPIRSRNALGRRGRP